MELKKLSAIRRLSQAVRMLVADKEDTTQVFIILNILGAGAARRSWKRFKKHPHAARILAHDKPLIAYLNDQAYLNALPENSLGRRYRAFIEAGEITADGLTAASENAPRDEAENMSPERLLFHTRQRDAHDLWHVVNGYGRDSVGELALLAFTYRQLGNIGLMLIIATGFFVTRKNFPQMRIGKAIFEGFRRGRIAAWLPAVEWETLLPLPLDTVRKQLRLDTLPQNYRTLTTHHPQLQEGMLP